MTEKSDRFARITRGDLQALAKRRLSQQETLVFLAYRYTCWEVENLKELVQLVDLPSSTVQRLVCRLKNAGLIESDDPNASRVRVHDRARSRGARSCTIVHDHAIGIQQIKAIDLNLDPSAPDLREGSHVHACERPGLELAIEQRRSQNYARNPPANPPANQPEPIADLMQNAVKSVVLHSCPPAKSGRAGDQDLIAYLCKLFSIGEKLARKLVAQGSARCAEVPGGAPTIAEWKRFAFWAANEPTLAKSEAKFAASIDRLVPWLIQFRSTSGNRAANDAARGARSVLAPSESAQAAGSLVALLERNRGLDRRDQGGAG